MSIDATVWAWDQCGITPEQKLLLLYLADIVDMDDNCIFDVEHIKNSTGFQSKEKIMRCLWAMSKKGIIDIDFVCGGPPIRLLGIVHR